MSRELVVELIERKKALYREHYELEIAELAVEEELAYCAPEDGARLEVKLREANAKQVAVKAKIDRAHIFGPRYSHSFVPSLCIACFVDRNQHSSMVEVESGCGNGIKQFECSACKHVLRVNPL